jgi:hypothetical protein
MSSNWTDGMLSSAHWNSAVEINGDGQLYDGYNRYWDKLAACGSVAPSASTCSTGRNTAPPTPMFSDGAAVTAHAFPLATGEPDSVKDEIQGITCPATIDIAMGSWGGPRGHDIASLLAALGVIATQNGMSVSDCVIRVVVPDKEQPAVGLGSQVQVHCTGADSEDDDFASSPPAPYNALPDVHSKYMVVAGAGDGPAKVFMGSEDFTSAAANDTDDLWDEFDSTATNDALYSAFEANFNQIWNSTPVCGL